MENKFLLYSPRDIDALNEALKLAIGDAAIWVRTDDTRLAIHPHLTERLSQLIEKELRSTESQWNREVEAVLIRHLHRACLELGVSLPGRTFMGFLGVEQLFHFEPPRDERIVVSVRREESSAQVRAVAPEPQVAARYAGPAAIRVLRCDLIEEGAFIEFELARAGLSGVLPIYLITAQRAHGGSPISRLQLSQDGQVVMASTQGAPLGVGKYSRAPIQVTWWKEAGEHAGASDRFVCAEPNQDACFIYAMALHIQSGALAPQRPVQLTLSLPTVKPLRIYPAVVTATLGDAIVARLRHVRGLSVASRSRWSIELGESRLFTSDCVCIGKVKDSPTAPTAEEHGEPLRSPETAADSSARSLRDCVRTLSRQRALTTRIDVADGVLGQLAEYAEFDKLGLTIDPAAITGHPIFAAESRQIRNVWRVPVRAHAAPLTATARGKLAAASAAINEQLECFLPPGVCVAVEYEE